LLRKILALLTCFTALCAFAQQTSSKNSTWHFVVSGDSRNCGDVVMPAIAAGAIRDQAEFYWHLGDLRAIYDFDQDFKQAATVQGKSLTILDYENQAWNDFLESQVKPFGSMPFYLGIGNHETIAPKTRAEFVIQFADWLNAPTLRAQRLKDDPKDYKLHTYYHWIKGGIDFINLDNASHDQFDAEQMGWVEALFARDKTDPAIHTIVVGMHAALPDSISAGHSMNEWPEGVSTGHTVYQDLLKLRDEAHKNVYALASHSHFFMDGIFNTEYIRAHGGALPGWIVGTAGAVRYLLPPNSSDAKAAMTNVYGYLLGTASEDGSIRFEFKQLQEQDIPAEIVQRYTTSFVHECFAGNHR
jgi:hypothetical protein